MDKDFKELRELLLSIDGKYFSWNDARADVLDKLHELESKVECLSKIDEEKLLYWAKNLEHKSLSTHELIENAKWLLNNLNKSK